MQAKLGASLELPLQPVKASGTYPITVQCNLFQHTELFERRELVHLCLPQNAYIKDSGLYDLIE